MNGEPPRAFLNAVLLLPIQITPDYNRDKVIDDKDAGKVTKDNPWHWWINDDIDAGTTDGNDIPGQMVLNTLGAGADCSIGEEGKRGMHGMRDLEDFFPLYLDIKKLIEVLPPGSNAKYKLKQKDGALNFAYTDLNAKSAKNFLTELGGDDQDNATKLSSAIVTRITQKGVALDLDWLNEIKDGDDGYGVILVEGCYKSKEPLVLEVTDSKGNVLTQLTFFVSIDGVEKMYRHENLLSVDGVSGGVATNLGEPANYPDKLCENKSFVFVHGYNVSPEEARGANAEMFKRLWWSGSKAKFYGVTWHGDQRNNTTVPDYHKNVINAFTAAQPLATFINGLGGNVTVAAHSLGNMVVGSAIQDWNASVSNYFMIDAAVALESYDGGAATNDAMAYPDWSSYQPRVWASEWNADSAFASGDQRKSLTWRDRLKNVGANTYNFYSSSEQVLRKEEGAPGYWGDTFFVQLWTQGIYAWAMQEKLKGRQIDHNIGVVHGKVGSTYGGWAFSKNILSPAPAPPQPHTASPSEAAGFSDAALLTNPIFDPGFSIQISSPSPQYPNGHQTNTINSDAPSWIADLTDSTKGSATAQAHRNQLLAEMFPARTLPAGANEVGKLSPEGGENRNYNMPLEFTTDYGKWPRNRLFENVKEWYHGDFKDMAYSHLFALFDKIVEKGDLKK